jgi:mannan endo-1,6-alpha-mannosidase
MSQDSIKSAAKTLAGGIIAAYNDRSDPIPGLFGDPYYFWEDGVVWNSLISYAYLTGDSQYNAIVSEALQHQIGDFDAFMPVNQTKTLGNDDQSFWALAALTAAEVGLAKPEGLEWVDLAKNVFDIQVQRWDNETCGGGLRWQIFTFNNGYNYKNTLSNGNFFLLGARLAQFTGNKTYAEWAEKAFDWSQEVGLVSDEWLVYDGTDAEAGCQSVNHIVWSATHGAYLEGASILFNTSNGESEKWRDAVSGFVNSSSVFQDGDSSVLFEAACEENGKCDIDQRAFKGLAARSYARAAISAGFQSGPIDSVLRASAKAAAASCDGEGDDVECALRWNDDGDDKVKVKEEGLGETFAALEAVQALLYSQTGSIVSGNATTNQTTSPSGTPSGSPSGTSGAAAPENTGAAGRLEIAGSVVFMATLVAFVGL